MCYGSSFPSYWNEGMGYAEYMVDEEIEYWDDRYDGEDNAQSALENALAEIEEYKSGKAFEVATKIRKQKPLDPKEILSDLSKFKSKSPIVRWMVNACNFLFCPGIISDYIYQELEESDEAPEGLKFDQQVCIIWDINDIYSKHQSDCLDAETSGCGVYAPLLNYRIDKKFEKIDLNDIMERMQWPRKISELFQEFEELTH